MEHIRKNRGSGVLMHISSLPGAYGCGNLGRDARAFVDFLKSAGFSYWQILPICITDEYHSPYASYGAFSGDPNYIDPESLLARGLITEEECAAARYDDPYVAAFPTLRDERIALYKKAAARVSDRAPILRYMDEHPHIANFCLFMACREKNGGDKDLSPASPYDEETLFAWQFMQYEFFRAFGELHDYASEKGIRLIGDIPIYVSQGSADVFERPELFDLRKDGTPRRVAGCPPDAFTEDGQRWGNPLYNWKEMKKDGYAWWRDRVTHMLSLFDGIRIDHFRGFEAYYSIPATETTARNGKWVKGPGRPFIDMLKKTVGDRLVIAEDLGNMTPAAEQLVDYSGFYSTRVLEFAFDDPSMTSRHMPYGYEAGTAAYTGTHDNNTLLGFLFEADDDVRDRMFRYCGYEGKRYEDACAVIRRTLLSSHADLVIFPIQDLLGYGADTRMNTPGRAEGNWTYRVTWEQLGTLSPKQLREENMLYGRYKEPVV